MIRHKPSSRSKATPEKQGEVTLAVHNGVVPGTAVQADDPRLAASGGVPTTRLINTTAPLAGGGDLSADRTLSVSTATTAATGVVELATSGENLADRAVQGNDARINVVTTKGDIYGASAANTPARLGVGANGRVLEAASGEATGLIWRTHNTTKGDVLSHDGTTNLRKAVGSDGQSLAADSSQATGLVYKWGTGLFGISEFGSGCDGTLTVASGVSTLGANVNAPHYTTLTIDSGGTLRNAGGSTSNFLVIYCSVSVTGADATSILTTQITSLSPSGGTGAGGGGGGGAGGASGVMPSSIYIYAKEFLGTGTVNADGNPGVAGANATVASATANGANGSNPSSSHFMWNVSVSGSSVNGNIGQGGLSAGTGGLAGTVTGAAGLHVDGTISSIRDMSAWAAFYGWAFASSASTGTQSRRFNITSGGTGAAGGRNTGAQGGGGGGSSAGALPWPVTTTVCQAGVQGGAGGAGAAGAGGGAGGSGSVGGLIYIVALRIASGWIFTAVGGVGGNGGNGFGNGGGGAPGVSGDGGFIICFTMIETSATFTVTGGIAATPGNPGAGGGAAGGAGVAGRSGPTPWKFVGVAA